MGLSKEELNELREAFNEAWKNKKLDEMTPPGMKREVIVLYGERLDYENPDHPTNDIHEQYFGLLWGIKPGAVLLTVSRRSNEKPSKFAGVLERNQYRPGEFSYRGFEYREFQDWLGMSPSEELAEKFPYSIYYQPAGGMRQTLHFGITADRWQRMEAFLNKWLPVA